MKTNKPEWKLSKQYGRDIHNSPFFEAICPHGVGHHKGVHGCDGCCENCPKEIWDKVTCDEHKNIDLTKVSSPREMKDKYTIEEIERACRLFLQDAWNDQSEIRAESPEGKEIIWGGLVGEEITKTWEKIKTYLSNTPST